MVSNLFLSLMLNMDKNLEQLLPLDSWLVLPFQKSTFTVCVYTFTVNGNEH